MAYVYPFQCFFTKSKVGVAPSAAPTVDVIDRAADSLLVTGGAATALASATGVYKYDYSSATKKDLIALFKSTDTTVDLQQVPGIPMPAIEVLSALDAQGLTAAVAAFLDVAISSRPTAAAIWAAATRTLTQTAAQVAAVLAGSAITIQRGDSLSVSLTGLGVLTGYVSLDFTVKSSPVETDDQAVIRIRKNASGLLDGLLRLNGAAAVTAAQGSITVTDPATGAITIALAAAATALLTAGGASYDVQMITATGVATLTAGTVTIAADVTRAVS